jgi:hypothetical protein
MAEHEKSHIVVLSGGFGGLTFCQHFRHPAARVTLVDRTVQKRDFRRIPHHHPRESSQPAQTLSPHPTCICHLLFAICYWQLALGYWLFAISVAAP